LKKKLGVKDPQLLRQLCQLATAAGIPVQDVEDNQRFGRFYS
jgi:hypothetical protein